jgi:uncharacterized protein YdeI (YjbR/CyaY-like superfamily)
VNPKVDAYLERSTSWPTEIAALRTILLDCGLDEAFKWAKPCYAHGGHNIAIVQEMKPFLALMFFKGALLDDPHGVLEDQGPNSRSARRMTFTSVDEVNERADVVRALVAEAIAAEAAGLTVPEAPELELVAELQERLDADPNLRAAFEALTPGRQREYHLHIASAKQSETRRNRIDRVIPQILDGRGLRDR